MELVYKILIGIIGIISIIGLALSSISVFTKDKTKDKTEVNPLHDRVSELEDFKNKFNVQCSDGNDNANCNRNLSDYIKATDEYTSGGNQTPELVFFTELAPHWKISSTGNLLPHGDDKDVGSASFKVRDVYEKDDNL